MRSLSPLRWPVWVQLGEGVTNSIAATLQGDPLSEQILRFLLENETAMDTAQGIANWWVRRDERAVQAALDRLIACGVITPHTFTSGILYGLTRKTEIRAWLRAKYAKTAAAARPAADDGKNIAGS